VGHIAARGLSEDTLLVFLSDNGGQIRWYLGNGPTTTSNAPLRGEKGMHYEGGVRIPMIVRWPGTVPAGMECDVPVVPTDIMPTCLEAAHVRAPKGMDGLSLLPMLTGGAPPERDAICFHYPHYHHDSPSGAIREGDWKLLERFENGDLELYNLHDDLGETTNLADARPDLAGKLQGRLAAWRESVGAKRPEPNPAYEPARASQWKETAKPWWTAPGDAQATPPAASGLAQPGGPGRRMPMWPGRRWRKWPFSKFVP